MQKYEPGANLELDSLLHQPVRTKIVAFLIARGEATFRELKNTLHITDGNLDAHMRKLVAAEYITTHKQSGQGRPQTTYILSAKGESAFRVYLDNLQTLFNHPR